MKIILNGKETDIADSLNINQLLALLAQEQKRVIVELNGEIAEKEKYGTISLHNGDSVEIVHFVGGG